MAAVVSQVCCRTGTQALPRRQGRFYVSRGARCWREGRCLRRAAAGGAHCDWRRIAPVMASRLSPRSTCSSRDTAGQAKWWYPQHTKCRNEVAEDTLQSQALQLD